MLQQNTKIATGWHDDDVMTLDWALDFDYILLWAVSADIYSNSGRSVQTNARGNLGQEKPLPQTLNSPFHSSCRVIKLLHESEAKVVLNLKEYTC